MFTVIKDKCIGCGACVSIAPEVFDFDTDGLAIAKENVGKEFKDKGMQALENYPTEAIEFKDKGMQALESCPTEAIEYKEKE